MVGPKIYHLKYTRNYTGFREPANVLFDKLNAWFDHEGFSVKRKHHQFSRGKKRGIHINHVPKFKLHIIPAAGGSINVAVEYYAKIKLGTAIVAGILTSGITTFVGVGTLAVQLAEADGFVNHFWAHVDRLAGAYVLISAERLVSDGKGNLVMQPVVVAQSTATGPPQPYHGSPQPYQGSPHGHHHHHHQQPYPGSPQPGYPGQQQPYPGQQQPYPGQQQPYAGQQQPYPGSPQPGYPGSPPPQPYGSAPPPAGYPGQPPAGYPGQPPAGYPGQAPSGLYPNPAGEFQAPYPPSGHYPAPGGAYPPPTYSQVKKA